VKKHKTKDGTVIPISEMTDSHLENTIRFIERRAREGILVEYGGLDGGDGQPWYDTGFLQGEVALRVLGYYDYVEERDRRSRHPDNMDDMIR